MLLLSSPEGAAIERALYVHKSADQRPERTVIRGLAREPDGEAWREE